jgi:TetR/AcrR family transcriptional repressor of nem operon
MHEALEDESLSPCSRLQRYLEIITNKLEQDNWSRGCLIGDLSLEVSPNSEFLRTHLQSIFQEWKAYFGTCIAQAQSVGEISDDFSSDDLADFLLAGWQGSILRMKVEQSPAPLERFKKIVFNTIFKRSTPS